MKNFATRILALVVVLSVLLLPASALAAERNAFTLTVGNLELYSGEESITIPVGIQIGGGVDLSDPNGRGYGLLSVLSEDASVLSALASVENGEIRAYLSGMEYGIVIPLEQLMALAEPVLSQLENELTGAASSLSPELQAAAMRTGEAYMAMIEESAADPEAYSAAQLNALGITLTEGAEAQTVMLFDVEASALPTTVVMEEKAFAEIFDAQMNATPAATEFYNAYFDLLNEILVMAGEEKVDVKAELAKIDGSMSLTGTIYTAENGTLAEMVMPITIDGETVEFPLTITSLTDEQGTYFDFLMEAANNGEEIYIEVYVDNFTDEEGSFANISLSAGIGAEDAAAYENEFTIGLYSAAREEGSTYGIDLYALEDGEPVVLSLGYFGYPVVSTEESDSYSGYLFLTAENSETTAEAYLGTSLTLSGVPEGELLTLAESINPLTADNDALEKLSNDAMMAVMQGLGTLMQNPTIAALMGN